jgi:hypothetical protein
VEGPGPPPSPDSLDASAPRAGSVRLRIASVAADAAIATPGVAGLESGPLGRSVTIGGGRRVEGVRVGALSGGRYEVELHLACELVPLRPLAEAVRARVLDAVASAGLSEATGPVHVHVEEIADPEPGGGRI